MIILEDGNIESAIDGVLKGGYFDSGQGISPKVFVVHR